MAHILQKEKGILIYKISYRIFAEIKKSAQTLNKGQSDSVFGVITGTGANQSQWLQDENADRIAGKIKHTPGRAQKECLSGGIAISLSSHHTP